MAIFDLNSDLDLLPLSFPSIERYKAKSRVIDRCHMAYTDPAHLMSGAKVHFKDKFFVCKSGVSKNTPPEICCQILGPARWRISTVLVKYKTNPKGFIAQPFRYDLFSWTFGESTYTKLRQLHDAHSLLHHDFTIDCLNEDYQQLALRHCESSLWGDDLNAAAKEQIESIAQFGKQAIGRALSIEEIQALLNNATPVSGASVQAPSQKVEIEPKITLISGKRKIRMDLIS